MVKENEHLAVRWSFQAARGKIQHRRDLFAGQVEEHVDLETCDTRKLPVSRPLSSKLVGHRWGVYLSGETSHNGRPDSHPRLARLPGVGHEHVANSIHCSVPIRLFLHFRLNYTSRIGIN